MTLRQGLVKSLVEAVCTYDRTNLEESTEYNHVEYLRVLQLCSLVHGINAIYVDVLSGRKVDDAESVIDEDSASASTSARTCRVTVG